MNLLQGLTAIVTYLLNKLEHLPAICSFVFVNCSGRYFQCGIIYRILAKRIFKYIEWLSNQRIDSSKITVIESLSAYGYYTIGEGNRGQAATVPKSPTPDGGHAVGDDDGS